MVNDHVVEWHIDDGELADEALRLVRGAGVGQVAAQGEDVRPLRNLGEHRRQRSRRHRLGAVKVADGSDADAITVHRATASPSRRALNAARPSRKACSGSTPDLNATLP